MNASLVNSVDSVARGFVRGVRPAPPIDWTTRASRGTAFGIAVLLFGLVSGCGEDSAPGPTDTESSGVPFIYQPPTTAEHVIYNVLTAYARRDAPVYAVSLHPDFRFVGAHPTTDEGVELTLDDELATTARLMAEVDSIAIDWEVHTFSEESDVAGYPAEDGYRSVRLDDVIVRVEPSAGGDDVVVECDVVFVLVEYQGDEPRPGERHHQWRLVYQEELDARSVETWTDVKLRYLDGSPPEPDAPPALGVGSTSASRPRHRLRRTHPRTRPSAPESRGS